MKMLQSLACSLVLVASSASAALYDRGDGLIYDDVLNVTWLQDANLAATNTFGLTGFSGWGPGLASSGRATDWLTAMNRADYKGFDNWRLPRVLPAGDQFTAPTYSYTGPDFGFNITRQTSELSYMFYENLGNVGGHAPSGAFNCVHCLNSVGPFMNLQPGLYAAQANSQYTIAFNMGEGYQNAYVGEITSYFWAVRDGDAPAVRAVPEPETLPLFIAGLALCGYFAGRKHRSGENAA